MSKTLFTKTITVTFTTDKTLLTSLDIPTTNDYYTLGTIEFYNDKRIIVKHTGNRLKLQVPFNGLISGQSVKIIKGCDKSKEVCLDTFNNLDNFVGMPYVKSGQNPVVWGLV